MTIAFRFALGLDIGSNSVGSAWIDHQTGEITVGLSVFPAGVDESDEKRGDPKNAKRRMMRRARITLARRAQRKRLLRLKLISAGLLPPNAEAFEKLLQETDPWELRRKGLTESLSPYEFGRVLLHMSQRRGALGFDAEVGDAGKVKSAIIELQTAMLGRYASDHDKKAEQELRGVIENLNKKKGRTDQENDDLDAAQEGLKRLSASLLKDCNVTYGRFIADLRDEELTPITTPDKRKHKIGQREWRKPVRNRAGEFRFHADRSTIHDEFTKLWNAQKHLGGPLAEILTDELRLAIDDETRNSNWRHKGLLFGQRMQSWDLGTLGRCVLEPTERCVAHADMYASRYLVVETINNLKIIERGREARPLTPAERQKIKAFLSSPFGVNQKGKQKGQPKRSITVTDLREEMGWGHATRTSQFRFNIEADEERQINTDWFSREIIHGAITAEKWKEMPERSREGINHAILKHDPDEEKNADKLKSLVMRDWAGLSDGQADALVAAWKKRPRPDAKRLNMSRRAVRDLLIVMDRDKPWADEKNPGQFRWLDQNTARRLLASNEATAQSGPSDADIHDETDGCQQQAEPKQTPTLNDENAETLGRSLVTESPTRKMFVKTMHSRGIEPDGHPKSDYFRVLRAWEKALRDAADPQNVAEREAKQIEIKMRRYVTGAKGATARDRHYMRKHCLKKNGEKVLDSDGRELAEPAPAPLISNPVVRKAIHEVRRHIVEFMISFGCRPDEIHVELAREAKMGKIDADRALFTNRLRARIRNEIITKFDLDARSPTQQRAAVERVVLAVQQNCVCPLCGKTMGDGDCGGITFRTAALGKGCEVAHIVPKGSGGRNGSANVVLAHTKCNRDMGRRTPREFWEKTLEGGFEEGITWIENIYGNIVRIKPSETKTATDVELWKCYLTEQARPRRGSPSAMPPNYFTNRFDKAKIEQFKKDVKDIQQMTASQGAATQYASRQVMTYLADALYDGKGLPERSAGGDEKPETRRIFNNDGLWTSRLRREWGLFFDEHDAKASGLTNEAEHERKEKNRGDHRHHAIDAIVIALCTEQAKRAWDEREQRANKAGINTADEEEMENYRKQNRLDLPAPFSDRQHLRDAVQRAVFGGETLERPVSHRPVKNKLIGAFHKATQYGPVVDTWVQNGSSHQKSVDGRVAVRQDVLGEANSDFLKPSHLRMPRTESDDEAVERIARRLRIGKQGLSEDEATKAARKLVKSKGFTHAVVDPKPEKGGLVRDVGLRRLLRRRIEERGLDPDSYTNTELKRTILAHGPLTQDSGVPIHSVVLLWSNSDPVTIKRDQYDYATGKRSKNDAISSLRLYDGQNNHHIEIRVAKNKKGIDKWSGEVVTGYEAAQLKLAKLRAFREAGIPSQKALRKLSKAERTKRKPELRRIELAHPIVDRADDDKKGGQFVMSLCEGEMLLMKHKNTKEVGYFVVAKLDKPQSIVVVPHWDARKATERKDSDDKKVPDSKREQFAVTPSDLKDLAPPGRPHAMKVRVSPLGKVTVITETKTER